MPPHPARTRRVGVDDVDSQVRGRRLRLHLGGDAFEQAGGTRAAADDDEGAHARLSVEGQRETSRAPQREHHHSTPRLQANPALWTPLRAETGRCWSGMASPSTQPLTFPTEPGDQAMPVEFLGIAATNNGSET